MITKSIRTQILMQIHADRTRIIADKYLNPHMPAFSKVFSVMPALFFILTCAYAGEVKLTTYYPAPYGEYKNIKTTGDTYLATDANSKVGIGTTTPRVALDVCGQTNTMMFRITDSSGMPYQDNWIGMADNMGDGKKWLHIGGITDTDGIRRSTYWANSHYFNGNVGIGMTNPGSTLVVKGSGNTNATSALNIIDNTNTTLLFLRNNGYLGLGLTNPQYRLELPNIANNSGRARANSWRTYSSIRWKKNIKPIQNVLDKIKRLRGVYFDWKENGTHDIGMIAEEVGEVVPEVVSYEENGKDARSLDYSRLVALLVEAVKEQQKEIEGLKVQLNKMAQ